jgi:phage tail sheath protein FI
MLSGYSDFERIYGGPGPLDDLAHAVRGFFENGGRRLYVARTDASSYEAGLAMLGEVDEISVVAAPGSSRGGGARSLEVARLLVAHCEQLPHRFAVLDTPDSLTPAEVLTYRSELDSSRAGLYYPWVEVLEPTTGSKVWVPPSGFVAGAYARNDIERGVHRAPANLEVRLAVGLERLLDDREEGELNPAGVDCLRHFEGRGYLVWGARTLSSDPEWKYVSVRRYFSYLEHSIDQGTQWASFEPNAEPLWLSFRRVVEDFLYAEFRAGRLQGITPDEAFFVRCDRTTMTQDDLDNGRLVCLVGVAAVKPAEFVIFRIGHLTAGSA